MLLGKGEGAGSPCPPAQSAHVTEAQALDLARSFLPDLAPHEPLPESAGELWTWRIG